jgi:hypothetical protein
MMDVEVKHWKADCKITADRCGLGTGPAVRGQAHVVTHRYDDNFTAWFGAASVRADAETLEELGELWRALEREQVTVWFYADGELCRWAPAFVVKRLCGSQCAPEGLPPSLADSVFYLVGEGDITSARTTTPPP